MENEICFISKKELPVDNLILASTIKRQLIDLIKKDYPDFSNEKFISSESLNIYRRKYLERLIRKEHHGITSLEKDVLKSIQENNILSENVEPEMEAELSYGDKLADKIATFGGSWPFIITFFSFLMIWMTINIVFLSQKAFDPYPFILLNLILSCLAAIQAPIIMMSQNRQEQKDRIRSEQDYKVNLKAELEVRLLHEKLDHMIHYYNRGLMEIQEMQMDYLEELSKKLNSKN